MSTKFFQAYIKDEDGLKVREVLSEEAAKALTADYIELESELQYSIHIKDANGETTVSFAGTPEGYKEAQDHLRGYAENDGQLENLEGTDVYFCGDNVLYIGLVWNYD
jgi:hypothetical protein